MIGLPRLMVMRFEVGFNPIMPLFQNIHSSPGNGGTGTRKGTGKSSGQGAVKKSYTA